FQLVATNHGLEDFAIFRLPLAAVIDRRLAATRIEADRYGREWAFSQLPGEPLDGIVVLREDDAPHLEPRAPGCGGGSLEEQPGHHGIFGIVCLVGLKSGDESSEQISLYGAEIFDIRSVASVG